MHAAQIRRHKTALCRRRIVAIKSGRQGGSFSIVAPPLLHPVTLTANLCPSPQTGVTNSLLTIAAASGTTAGNAPGLPPTPSRADWRTNWMQGNLTALALQGRYKSGGAFAVCKGLDLYSVNGLLLGVHAGHAAIDTTIEIADRTIAVPDGHDGTAGNRIWIWLGQGGNLSLTINTLLPPAGNNCLLGSCTTSGGVITSIDYSGVMYAGTGDQFRVTADTSAPTDTPVSLLRFTTRNPNTTQEYKWNGTSHEVIPSVANPLPTAAGGIDPTTASYIPLHGSGSPNGVVTATVGKLYVDTTAGLLYQKQTGTGNTGWGLPSASVVTLRQTITSASVPAFALQGKTIFFADATSGAINVTLPGAAGINGEVKFVKIDSSANTVTVTAAGGNTINGASTSVLSTQWQSISLENDGVSAWNIF